MKHSLLKQRRNSAHSSTNSQHDFLHTQHQETPNWQNERTINQIHRDPTIHNSHKQNDNLSKMIHHKATLWLPSTQRWWIYSCFEWGIWFVEIFQSFSHNHNLYHWLCLRRFSNKQIESQLLKKAVAHHFAVQSCG